MKTVTSTLTFLLASLAFTAPMFSAPKTPPAKLLDMYAVRDGDAYVVHVLANGDISEFLSDRKKDGETYRLTLDVPALSPLDSKYDVATPFSRNFQVWPMQLGKKIYSRIEIELTTGASSVVGLQNASHLFVRIHLDTPTTTPAATVAALPAVPEPEPEPELAPEPEPEPEPEPAAASESEPVSASETVPESIPEMAPAVLSGSQPPGATVDAAPSATASSETSTVNPTEDALFFSLFPTPVRQQQTLFNLAADDAYAADEPARGIRLGRFDVQPSIDVSWVRGDNLLLASDGPFVDNAYLVRARVVASLLDSAHDLKLAYEGRYRDFKNFELDQKFTQFVELSTRLEVTPTTSAEISNHFVHGSFESQEFDPGGEVVASTDPFYRNYTNGVFSLHFSERLGAELRGSYNVVQFLNPGPDFFDYKTATAGGAFLYDLSPLTSLVGEYERIVIPEPQERPEAGSVGNQFLFGVRGELTETLRGEVRAGYAVQKYQKALVAQDFSGFVADASLTRDFGESAALTAKLGRRTNPSAFGDSGYYVSSFGRLQFITPFARNFRFTASTSLYANDYPVPTPDGLFRNDTIFSGGLGVAYFFTPLTYLSFDYRHDQRKSNLDEFVYRNNALQVMVGLGFLSR
jgi:hypothetical protein